jgi:hypothetical protein
VNKEVVSLVVTGKAKALGVIEETDDGLFATGASAALSARRRTLSALKASRRTRGVGARSVFAATGDHTLTRFARRTWLTSFKAARSAFSRCLATALRGVVQTFSGDGVVHGA